MPDAKRPTVGRIVHYHWWASKVENAPLVTSPAIVLEVGEDYTLLQVFTTTWSRVIRSTALPAEKPTADCWSWPPKE